MRKDLGYLNEAITSTHERDGSHSGISHVCKIMNGKTVWKCVFYKNANYSKS